MSRGGERAGFRDVERLVVKRSIRATEFELYVSLGSGENSTTLKGTNLNIRADDERIMLAMDLSENLGERSSRVNAYWNVLDLIDYPQRLRFVEFDHELCGDVVTSATRRRTRARLYLQLSFGAFGSMYYETWPEFSSMVVRFWIVSRERLD